MLNGVMLLWFILVVLSLAFVIYDAMTNTPVSWVQKLAWILVTFYTGPVGLFFYLLACRNPTPGDHSHYTAAHWKQAVNSEMHCLAGDASGIILAAIVVSYFQLSNGVDLTIEYVTAFVVGLLIFQALMMRSMYDNDYAKAVRKTFFAETVSMNMVMVGMIPVMVALMHHWPGAHDPLHPRFWFIMGLATTAGGITAYPINSWLVRNKLKHGCMTLPAKIEPSSLPHQDEHQHAHGHHHGATASGHQHHAMATLSTGTATWMITATFAALLLAAWLTSTFLAPILF